MEDSDWWSEFRGAYGPWLLDNSPVRGAYIGISADKGKGLKGGAGGGLVLTMDDGVYRFAGVAGKAGPLEVGFGGYSNGGWSPNKPSSDPQNQGFLPWVGGGVGEKNWGGPFVEGGVDVNDDKKKRGGHGVLFVDPRTGQSEIFVGLSRGPAQAGLVIQPKKFVDSDYATTWERWLTKCADFLDKHIPPRNVPF
jgi:hypothetical protein